MCNRYRVYKLYPVSDNDPSQEPLATFYDYITKLYQIQDS